MKIPFTNFALSLSKNDSAPRGVYTQKGGSLLNGYLRDQGIRIAPSNLWAVYRLNADVYSCIREWKQSVGAGGYRLIDNRDDEVDAPPNETAFIDLFFRNSGGISKIKNNIIRDLGICGNCYFEIVKNANGGIYGLKRLDPRTMYIVADKHGQVIKYYQRMPGHEDIGFDPSELWHVILDEDPDNELLGMSPLETALWEARTDIAAAQSNYYFFENDAVPSSVYVLDETLSEEAQKAAFDKIKTQFSGATNKHKSAVLSGVKEIKTISMSQKDMEFVIGRKFNTDKVCSVYGVPKHMLGYSENVNYSNGVTIRADYYAGTIVPLEELIAEAITNVLFQKIKIQYSIFKYDPQDFGEQLDSHRFYLEETKSGILTMRQYKSKTGQNITEEDEQDPMIDKHIIHNGGGARLLEDVGVDVVADPNDPVAAENMIKLLENRFKHEDN